MKTPQDFVAFGQANVEAVLQSGKILVDGVQTLARDAVASVHAQVNENVATFRALVAAKSVREAFELQSGFVRASAEKAINEVVRGTEASVRLVQQATAPVAARFQAAQSFAQAA